MKNHKVGSYFGHGIILTLFILLFSGCGDDDGPSADAVPIANAAANSEAVIGEVVKLDASSSQSPDGMALTYNWSFLSKPAGSVSAIIGAGKSEAEFTLDKAGKYEIQLEVSNGAKGARTSLVVSNKTPIISSLRFSNSIGELRDLFDNQYLPIGSRIEINGDFFSKDVAENNVTVDDITYPIIALGDSWMSVEVPDDATSGVLVLSVGEQSVTTPEPISIVDLPVSTFVDNSDHLEENSSSGLLILTEIGSQFKPLVNGKLLGFSLRMPKNGDYRVTLWDADTEIDILTETIEISSTRTKFVALSTAVSLEKDHLYMVTVQAVDWFWYADPQNQAEELYPITSNTIEIITSGSNSGGGHQYPNKFNKNIIAKGVDVLFAEDSE